MHKYIVPVLKHQNFYHLFAVKTMLFIKRKLETTIRTDSLVWYVWYGILCLPPGAIAFFLMFYHYNFPYINIGLRAE